MSAAAESVKASLAFQFPPEDPDRDTERRLLNWGAWSRTAGGRGRCGSAEGGYRAPYPTPPGEFWGGVDVLDAELVEAGICRLPEFERRLLVDIYAKQASPRAVCRWLGMRWDGQEWWKRKLVAARCTLHLTLSRKTLLYPVT